ncbi:MAG: response regulator [Deltaproteobacteria bacterium]|nr:response regulator [Deltaproteobacteria bacterium]
MVASIKDMSDTIRLRMDAPETCLQDSQELEAVAALAGGVAHQFNNALVAIAGNIELLNMDLPGNPVVDKYSRSMRAAVGRMTQLTDQLLAYARGGKYLPMAVSLNESVETFLAKIRPGLGPAVLLETHLETGLPQVVADPAQMQMVLSTLVENSKEAMAGSGLIRITTMQESLEAEAAGPRGLIPGKYVCLQVEDTGEGMDRETRNRVFEPFFTTKWIGRGLGMAAVYGIVRNHEGWIGIESEPGRGTTVRVYLPVPEGVSAPVQMELEAGFGEGRQTVMVVEDEAPVLAIFREILERMGFRVLGAETGAAAVNKVGNLEEGIDLVILDVKLPDMTARDVYLFLREARPHIKVLLCSGYDMDRSVREILDMGAQDFLQKPFGVQSLSIKVREILEKEAKAA